MIGSKEMGNDEGGGRVKMCGCRRVETGGAKCGSCCRGQRRLGWTRGDNEGVVVVLV